MEKTFLLLSAFLLIAPLTIAVFAAEEEENITEAADVRTFEGNVALVYTESRVKNYPGRVEVVDESGQRLAFIVAEVTKVSKNGVRTNFLNVKKGDKVRIEYVSDNKNHKVVQSLRVSTD